MIDQDNQIIIQYTPLNNVITLVLLQKFKIFIFFLLTWEDHAKHA